MKLKTFTVIADAHDHADCYAAEDATEAQELSGFKANHPIHVTIVMARDAGEARIKAMSPYNHLDDILHTGLSFV